MTATSQRPLAGITVLDLTHMVAGPYGTQLLTDLGALTIKIEPPGGEPTRKLLQDDPEHAREGMGAYFLTLNRGKRSVCIDLKNDKGRAVFLDLVREADVVFDNFSDGVTARLGIDHAALAAVNPRVITCSVTGFGQTGPHTQRPAFDQVVQAMGGGMSITGQPGAGPVRSGIPIGDLGGGLFGALGVLAALQARHATGRGQHVDISMLDAQVSLLTYMATMHLMSGQVPGRLGNGHFVHVPYNSYATSDGHIIVACIGDAFFERFAQAVGCPILQSPHYKQQPRRLADKELIDQLVGEHMAKHSTAWWLDRLNEARVPCGPVNDFQQALTDPQVLARDMVVDVPLQGGGSVRMPGNPVKLSADPGPSWKPAPATGADTDSVLRQVLGYSPAQVAHLRELGGIA